MAVPIRSRVIDFDVHRYGPTASGFSPLARASRSRGRLRARQTNLKLQQEQDLHETQTLAKLKRSADAAMNRAAPGSVVLLPVAMFLAALPALAQQPVQPLPKVGSCPLGYYSSGSYCVPSRGGNARGALGKKRWQLPTGLLFRRQLLPEQPQQQPPGHPETGKLLPAGLVQLRQLLRAEPLT